MQIPFSVIEVISLAYFFLLWAGYASYAKYRARQQQKASLSRSLRAHREAWAERLLSREMRMTDASLLASQERVAGFFASTTLLLIAAVLTALTSSYQIAEIASHIPFTERQTNGQIEAKLALLLLLLIFAFFKVTWSLRQYGFTAVVVGSAPDSQERISSQERAEFTRNLAKLMDSAGHDTNSCLRTYYFALSLMCWLGGTVPFVIVATITVFVLYNREFRSSAVLAIQGSYIPTREAGNSP
jgi:uncharacterized membrane protein